MPLQGVLSFGGGGFKKGNPKKSVLGKGSSLSLASPSIGGRGRQGMEIAREKALNRDADSKGFRKKFG